MEHLLGARSCADYFTYISSFTPQVALRGRYYYFPHFLDGETNAQKYVFSAWPCPKFPVRQQALMGRD